MPDSTTLFFLGVVVAVVHLAVPTGGEDESEGRKGEAGELLLLKISIYYFEPRGLYLNKDSKKVK